MRIIKVAAGILWRGERFLAACRPEGKPRAGFWEFPGGKQEQGESIEETLARELEEELGVSRCRIIPWITTEHDYPDVRVHLHFMHVVDFAGEPRPRDGQELRWITSEEACALNFLPADRAIVARISPPNPASPS